MRQASLLPALLVPLLSLAGPPGCAASLPPPTEHMVSVEASVRAAQQLGADKVPSAAERLGRARAAVERAKLAMKDGKNVDAESLLLRAEADADLAAALAKEGVLNAEVARLRARVAEEGSRK